ncbi:MAG: hypothetical protein ACTHKP_00570 [Nitrososphaeraceae archaeon]
MEDLSVFNQLLQTLNAVPAVAEVLNKPIKDVAPMTASEGDTITCLVEKSDKNAKDYKDDIKNYYLNKSSVSGATSSDPVGKAVADIEAQTVASWQTL